MAQVNFRMDDALKAQADAEFPRSSSGERFLAFLKENPIDVPADFKWSRSAAAERLGCHEIITEDLNDGQMYRGMVAINPFK